MRIGGMQRREEHPHNGIRGTGRERPIDAVGIRANAIELMNAIGVVKKP